MQKILKIIISVVVGIVITMALIAWGSERNIEEDRITPARINAMQFEKQYYAAKAAGASRADLCARTSIVAEAYLQANEPLHYSLWIDIRDDYCAW